MTINEKRYPSYKYSFNDPQLKEKLTLLFSSTK
jgi:hypothetical protein